MVEGIYDLFEEAFNWLIGIVGGLESNVVVLEVGCQDASVLGTNILKDVACGYI